MAKLKILRPKQWLKNGFVFIPLIFSGSAWDEILLFNSIVAFFLFCLAASAVYVLNDLHDISHDKAHPKKVKERPLASGEINYSTAIIILCILYALLILQIWLFPEVFKVLFIYIILNVGYTFVLKRQPVIDIFIISLGLMLRVVAGSIAIAMPISPWMLITCLALSLYITTIKRKREIVNKDMHLECNHIKNSKKVILEKYNRTLLDRYAEVAGTSTFIFYTIHILLWQQELLATIPLVIFGLFRYWYIVEIQDNAESPTDLLLLDKQLTAAIAIWAVTCIYILN